MKHKMDLKISAIVYLSLAVLFALLGVSEVKVCMFFIFAFVNATAVQVIEAIEAGAMGDKPEWPNTKNK